VLVAERISPSTTYLLSCTQDVGTFIQKPETIPLTAHLDNFIAGQVSSSVPAAGRGIAFVFLLLLYSFKQVSMGTKGQIITSVLLDEADEMIYQYLDAECARHTLSSRASWQTPHAPIKQQQCTQQSLHGSSARLYLKRRFLRLGPAKPAIPGDIAQRGLSNNFPVGLIETDIH
jgi:hypothetical protein